MKKFLNKVLVIGYGSVARCALPILLKHIEIPLKNITVIDFVDKRIALKPYIRRGLKYFQEKVTPINMAQLLSKYVSAGGLVIDLAWNIDTADMISWCHENKVLYANTSVEEWDPYSDIHKKTLFEKSLYYKQMEIRRITSTWRDGPTAVVDHGANPGLISHFTRQGLIDIAKKALRDKAVSKKDKKVLEDYIKERSFAHLAMKLGVKVIHISERDTQISNRPKKVNEFVGTWSIEGLREEGISPVELGWGTHEKTLPLRAIFPPYGPKNQVFISQMGINTWARSWVPYQEIIGMIVRHAEAFSISDDLTVWRRGMVVYRPTVYYAYMPCDDTIASLHELRCRNYELQPNLRIMSDEIVDGEDILGALIMGHRYNAWWTGSMLGIHESRRLLPNQNATTMQVAIGIVSAIMWMIDNPSKSVCVPDDLPHDYILNIAKPYLGRFISEPSDWSPFQNYQIYFRENPDLYLDKKNPWCLKNFLHKH